MHVGFPCVLRAPPSSGRTHKPTTVADTETNAAADDNKATSAVVGDDDRTTKGRFASTHSKLPSNVLDHHYAKQHPKYNVQEALEQHTKHKKKHQHHPVHFCAAHNLAFCRDSGGSFFIERAAIELAATGQRPPELQGKVRLHQRAGLAVSVPLSLSRPTQRFVPVCHDNRIRSAFRHVQLRHSALPRQFHDNHHLKLRLHLMPTRRPKPQFQKTSKSPKPLAQEHPSWLLHDQHSLWTTTGELNILRNKHGWLQLDVKLPEQVPAEVWCHGDCVRVVGHLVGEGDDADAEGVVNDPDNFCEFFLFQVSPAEHAHLKRHMRPRERPVLPYHKCTHGSGGANRRGNGDGDSHGGHQDDGDNGAGHEDGGGNGAGQDGDDNGAGHEDGGGNGAGQDGDDNGDDGDGHDASHRDHQDDEGHGGEQGTGHSATSGGNATGSVAGSDRVATGSGLGDQSTLSSGNSTDNTTTTVSSTETVVADDGIVDDDISGGAVTSRHCSSDDGSDSSTTIGTPVNGHGGEANDSASATLASSSFDRSASGKVIATRGISVSADSDTVVVGSGTVPSAGAVVTRSQDAGAFATQNSASDTASNGNSVASVPVVGNVTVHGDIPTATVDCECDVGSGSVDCECDVGSGSVLVYTLSNEAASGVSHVLSSDSRTSSVRGETSGTVVTQSGPAARDATVRDFLHTGCYRSA